MILYLKCCLIAAIILRLYKLINDSKSTKISSNSDNLINTQPHCDDSIKKSTDGDVWYKINGKMYRMK